MAEQPELDEEQAKELAQYDLTMKMTPFLDRHLILRILNFLHKVGMYKSEDISRAELKVLDATLMIDMIVETYELLNMEAPESVQVRRQEVLDQVVYGRDQVMDMLKALEDEDKVKKINSFKSESDLCREFEVEPGMIDDLVRYAKMQFDCGNYGLASVLLKHSLSILTSFETPSAKHAALQVSCIWGALGSALLNDKYDEASESIFKLDEFLENSKSPKREVLLYRTWLLHWALFALFKPSQFKLVDSKLVDFFLSEKSSLSIISLSCPHLFRYVGACLILQKRLKNFVKDTVWIISHESGSYADPITRFLLALYVEMDYDEAQRELQKCEQLCKSDYFLADHWQDFQEQARLHIFESYCRIHQCINIQMIASKLNMHAEEAELWIVKLIQSAKLDARIDSEKSRVVMTKAPPNVYQQVIEKTKNLAFRSTMLVSNLEKS